jgi:P27 family predicted phage terminase small subunit
LKNSPKPPSHLSDDAQLWWKKLTTDFDLDDPAALLLLQTALEAFDRMKQAKARIDQDGAAIADRFGQIKPHPLLTAERDSRAQMLMALKNLHLDIEPLRSGLGRPGGS